MDGKILFVVCLVALSLVVWGTHMRSQHTELTAQEIADGSKVLLVKD